MGTYQLFLDDFRFPEDAFRYTGYIELTQRDWYIARDYDSFVETIEMLFNAFNNFPSLISFDHDLADKHYEIFQKGEIIDYDIPTEEKTGYHCAKWLVNFCMDNNLPLPDYLCHSINPVGKKNILTLLDNFKIYQNDNNTI